MHVGGLLLVTTLALTFSCVLTETSSVKRKKRHLYPVMGFLQGYKMGQNFALQLPPFVLSPVVVLPVNQQQSVHIQGTVYENDNESLAQQLVVPQKLIQHCNSTGNSEIEHYNNSMRLDHVELIKDEAIEKDTFRQSITNDTVAKDASNDNMTTAEATISMVTESINTTHTTEASGPYPSAIYRNDNITMLSITESPKEDYRIPSTDDNWQNFSPNVTTELQVESRAGEVWSDDVNYTKRDFIKDSYYSNNNDRKPSVDSYYRRPINHLNQERWSAHYSGDNKLSSEFRPLAGLYYDGFLHKPPAKKTGFVPYGNSYYY